MSSTAQPTLTWRAGSATHIGRRHDNQDACLVGDGLYAVADGVGGEPGGGLASQLAVHALRRGFEETPAPGVDEMGSLAAIHRCSSGPYSRMATTLVVARFAGSRVTIGHVGDSRAYLLRGGRLRQLTRDHTAEAEWATEWAAGWGSGGDSRAVMSPNALTRALSRGADARPDVMQIEVLVGDAILLCTDGVCRVLEERQMTELLAEPDPRQAALMFPRTAIGLGGRDNATAVVVRVAGAEPAR